MINQPRADHYLSTPISPVRTISRSQKSNVETLRIKSQSDTHLCITIREGRRAARERDALRASKINPTRPVLISAGTCGWSSC